jgi:hypothetical protein
MGCPEVAKDDGGFRNKIGDFGADLPISFACALNMVHHSNDVIEIRSIPNNDTNNLLSIK